MLFIKNGHIKTMAGPDILGTLEAGKDADIVIWAADPLTAIGGEAHTTIIDGKIVYQA